MDHMKKYWSHELDCIRKGVNRQDGYQTTISPHYINDRFNNDSYADRVFSELDILWAISKGRIVEGYDSGENGRNGSNKGRNPEPERTIVGPAVSGDYCVVIVLMKTGTRFIVKTVFPADRDRYTKHIPTGGN
ncbi:hypothetical protein BK120_23055 [Paenibacillus sp. FSL A5-0031]|uniref:hypothetical protein n=1 Tax=Paenibacillus sp. FSL A5-0031 TaxID=1920420 RepID=UPI00096F6775|nr:hypothetical protein BK120_23055 [Paenibacillus sp. FSL A5-0031]